MTEKIPIGDLHLGGMKDLCVVKDGHPPFSFHRDLQLPAQPPKTHYKAPAIDTMTYWGPR